MRTLISLVLCLVLGACSGQSSGQSLFDSLKDAVQSQDDNEDSSEELTNSEIRGGLREALMVGTERVISQVGAVDGFNLDPSIHIPLPKSLQRVDSALSSLGLSSLTDDLETRLNRAAEVAAPEAKALFVDTISNMSLKDAQDILIGPDDAATQYFRRQTTDQLTELMRPVIENSLLEVGALQAYESAVLRYQELPFVPDVTADLTSYTTERSMDGIFYYLAREEAAIRENPLKRSTELLKKVFGK